MPFCASRRARTALGRVGLLITVAAFAGCDIPTEVPFVDVQWIFPIDDQSISVVELLPANVDTAGGNFQVAVDAVQPTLMVYTMAYTDG